MSTWYIALKDLSLLTRDKQALVLLLVLPLLLISIIGMSTGQFLTRDENLERIKIVAVDLNQGATSRNLIAELQQRPELLVTPVPSRAEAVEVLRRGDASLMLVIGPRFEELVAAVRLRDIFHVTNESAVTGLNALDLAVTTKTNSGVIGELLTGVLYSLVIKFIAPIAASRNAIARRWLPSAQDPGAATGKLTSPPDGLEHTPLEHAPKVSIVFQWVVPGFTVMFAFFLINIMARSFMIERDQGTLWRLLMTPVDLLPLLLGKTIPFYLTSIVQCALLFVCGRLLFGMPWGSQPAYLIPVILCTSASAASLGLLLSTLVRTDQQIASYGTALILVLSALSGCFLPRELFPERMKQISLFTPHAWSLKAFDEVLNQPVIDPALIARCCGILLAFSIVCFTAGWWRFRRTAQR
jgi:ABC-2 type transport system permease protein